MKKRTNWLRIVAVSAVALIGFGCGKSGNDGAGGGSGETINVAVCGPMSGSGAAFGEMIKKAATLQADAINAAGGINGKQVKLIIQDDKGNTTEAANVARKVVADNSICLVIGHFNSTCSNAAKEEYNRKGVVQFSPASTNVSVCAGYPWTFRNLYRDDYQGTFLADYAKEVLGLTKVGILYDNDDYGKGLMQAFTKQAEAIGLEVAEPVSYLRERTQDFKPLVAQLKDQQVDGIFVSGLYNEGALIAKAANNDLQLKVPILGGDGLMSPKLIELAGSAAEGMYITTPFLFNTGDDTPEAKAFMSDFKAKFGTEPDTWAALTYDAVGMAFQAINEVGTDRQALKDWFAATTTPEKGYQGVTGNTYFDAEGDCYSKGAHVAIVADGDFAPAPEQLKK